MPEKTHTPGPWTVRAVPNVGLVGHTGYAIDFNEDQEQVVDFVYEEADAHLIATSPKLLMAREDAVTILGPIGEHIPDVARRIVGYQRIIDQARMK